MCHDRILHRTRLRGANSKPPLKNFLYTLSAGLTRLPSGGGELRTLVDDLARKLDQYRPMPLVPAPESTRGRDNDIEEIVKDFYEISRVPGLDEIAKRAFAEIRGVEPSMPDALLDKIQKIGSYQKSALTLVSLARRYSIVRQASVTEVILDSASFAWSRRELRDVPPLLHVLERLAATQEDEEGWDAGEANRELSASEFQQKLVTMQAGAKVHAEIQLVWYLDAHGCTPPPRVIASNKEACYLCRTFMKSQTPQYVMPGTHGRLYEGWRLPASRASRSFYEDFTEELRQLAIWKVQERMADGVGKDEFPLESLPPPTPNTCSMISTVVEGDVDDAQSSGGDTVVPEDGRRLARSASLLTSPSGAHSSPPPASHSSPPPVPRSSPPTVSAPNPPSTSPLNPPLASSSSSPTTSSSPPPTTPSGPPPASLSSIPSIVPGTVASPPPTRSDHPSQAEQRTDQSLGNEAGRSEPEEEDAEVWHIVESRDTQGIRLDESLVLYVEYTTTDPRKDSTPLRIKARRLSEEESLGIPSAEVCKVEDLRVDKELVCDPHRRMLLRRGGHVFEIEWNGGDYKTDGQT